MAKKTNLSKIAKSATVKAPEKVPEKAPTKVVETEVKVQKPVTKVDTTKEMAKKRVEELLVDSEITKIQKKISNGDHTNGPKEEVEDKGEDIGTIEWLNNQITSLVEENEALKSGQVYNNSPNNSGYDQKVYENVWRLFNELENEFKLRGLIFRIVYVGQNLNTGQPDFNIGFRQKMLNYFPFLTEK